MQNWKQTVSANASTARISDITKYVKVNPTNPSPIDRFYEERNALLSAVTPDYALENPTVTPLVLVGLISSTENYFREIISGIISICPKAKEKSASKSLNLATAWFGYGALEKGAFENTSFSDPDTVKKDLKNIVGYDVSNGNQILDPLLEFGKLCELRHAIVHSAGLLAGKNAIKLQLPNSKNPVKISVAYSGLQESAEICTSLVCSSNLELFTHISKRWLHEWPKTPAYREQNQNEIFKRVWKLFYSEFDAENGLIQNPISHIKARNLIIRQRAQ
ncbi:hypothetical protein [Microbulbifer mangrovi]|uniref:hypothetical protein n=1 Tax=Microbulbifer mangrovi TaxID=927787 RepID=UPI0009908F6B|nr:hypothetical protein [Microbulbifer mangrovi]